MLARMLARMEVHTRTTSCPEPLSAYHYGWTESMCNLREPGESKFPCLPHRRRAAEARLTLCGPPGLRRYLV